MPWLPEAWEEPLFFLGAGIAAIPPLKVILEAAVYGEFSFLEHKFDRYENGREFWAGLATAAAWLVIEILVLL